MAINLTGTVIPKFPFIEKLLHETLCSFFVVKKLLVIDSYELHSDAPIVELLVNKFAKKSSHETLQSLGKATAS